MKTRRMYFTWEGSNISKTFGKIFGSPSTSSASQQSQTPTGYQSLSPQAQQAYDQALQGAQSLTAANFAPAPNNAQQMQAANYFATPINTVTPAEFQAGLSTFMNPYDQQVLQNTIRDLNTEAQGGYRDIASLASDAGGFGSNRRGLLESELQKNLLKTVGDVSAISNANNFEQAATRALADIGQTRTMNQQNMGSLFDIGTQFQNTATATQNAPAQLQQYLANLAGMLMGGGQTSSGSNVSTGAYPGVWGQLFAPVGASSAPAPK